MDPTPTPIVSLKVTAILVAHNQADAVSASLQALCASVPRELVQILVVDCASSDGTNDLDSTYPGVNILRLPQNFGATKALNIATRTARGEYLFLLTPGVEVGPDTVERLSAHLDEDSGAAAAMPLLTGASGDVLPQVQSIPNKESLAKYCAGGDSSWVPVDVSQDSIAVDYPPRAALMVRKQFVGAMNYFDERFGEYWADADLAIKIRIAGKKIRLFPGIRVIRRTPGQVLPGETIHQSDCTLGAALLLSKYDGMFSGMAFRWGAALKALFRMDFSLFSALASGKKLGSEASQSYPV